MSCRVDSPTTRFPTDDDIPQPRSKVLHTKQGVVGWDSSAPLYSLRKTQQQHELRTAASRAFFMFPKTTHTFFVEQEKTQNRGNARNKSKHTQASYWSILP